MICGVISPTWHRNCIVCIHFLNLVSSYFCGEVMSWARHVRRMNPSPGPSFDCGGLVSHALGSSGRKMVLLGSCRE